MVMTAEYKQCNRGDAVLLSVLTYYDMWRYSITLTLKIVLTNAAKGIAVYKQIYEKLIFFFLNSLKDSVSVTVYISVIIIYKKLVSLTEMSSSNLPISQ